MHKRDTESENRDNADRDTLARARTPYGGVVPFVPRDTSGTGQDRRAGHTGSGQDNPAPLMGAGHPVPLVAHRVPAGMEMLFLSAYRSAVARARKGEAVDPQHLAAARSFLSARGVCA